MARDKKELHVCFRHPLKTARRKCYECKRYICPECQVKSGGHIFCSPKCADKTVKDERREKLADFYEKKGKHYIFRMVFYPALVISLLLSYFFYMKWTESLAERGVERAAVPAASNKAAKPPDWAAPGPIEIMAPKEEEKISENEISVKGSAPKEAMVGLYLNGERVDALFSENGEWAFEKIPLKSNESILQVRYFDNYGNNGYSKAVRVHLLAKPSLAALPKREEPFFSPKLSTFLDLRQAQDGKKEILLTFDGGSNDNSAANILKVLSENNIKATVFLTGEYVKKYPERAKQLVAEGHTVCNHTYSHPHLTTYSFNEKQATLPGVTKEMVMNQLQKAEDLFQSITGKSFAPYWRAPFGEKNSQILEWAYEAGYRHVFWTPKLDTLDWVADKNSPLFREPKQILRNILSQTEKGDGFLDGGVVLMHLGSERPNEQSADTMLSDLIAQLKAKGYSFATVDNTSWAKEKPPQVQPAQK
jgi:peptidoglycan/xylan/chitin deacetylase (PgdA/CDA1 family)